MTYCCKHIERTLCTYPAVTFMLLLVGLLFAPVGAAYSEKTNTPVPLEVIEAGSSKTISLSHPIQVSIKGLDKWAREKGNDSSKFVLVVDGNELTGLPAPVLVDNGRKLQFDLKRTSGSEDVWDAILSRKTRGFTFDRKVPVMVRQAGVDVQGEYVADLIIVNKTWFFVFAAILLLSMTVFVLMAKKSDILRGPGQQPEGIDRRGKPNRKRYSLARTQMAFWFFVIIFSYVFIWMVTDDLSCVTTSVLGLMGISAATGLGAAAVDANKKGERDNLKEVLEEKRKNFDMEAEKLRSQSSVLTKTMTKTPDADLHEQKMELAAGLAMANKEIEDSEQKIQRLLEAEKPEVSKGFIVDILSDDNGLSFHRFQMFAWTIVLIIVFVSSVYRVLSMPEFDNTLLALMGISNGTYIGFKLPQQQG